MEKTSLNDCRTIYDLMICSNVDVPEFVVKKELMQNCEAAHYKYTAHLQESRKGKAEEKEENKRKPFQEELASVKRRKLELETVLLSLQQDIEKYSIEAGEKEDLKKSKQTLFEQL